MTAIDQSLYDQVAAAYAADQFDTVEQLLAPSFASGQVDIRLVELLGAVRMHQQRFADAVQMFNAVATSLPDSAPAALNLATAHFNLGQLVEAAEWAKRVVALDDTSADAHYLLGVIYPHFFAPGDLQAAQDHLQRVTQLRPDWFNGHFQHGRILGYSSKEPESEAALRRALVIKEDSAIAHEELGNILLETGRNDEAIAEYERALELNPQAATARAERDRLRSAKAGSRERLARYPRSTKEFADIEQVIDKYLLVEFRGVKPFISATTQVFTLGSCFATNIANVLKSYGVPAVSIPYPEDINNTFANLRLLEWVAGPPSEQTQAYAEQMGEARRLELNAAIKAAKVIIISLGVAPTFFDRETGEFVLTFGANFTAALSSSKYRFRTTTVGENVANLHAMIEILRTLNPGVPIMLTVSPVPLKATFERPSAVIADCISKSTLRVTAHEVMQSGIEALYYWPSFEVVRWLGGHTGPVFGTDDESPFHVSQTLIEKIMYAFIRIFGKADVLAAADARRAEASVSKASAC